MGCAVFCLQGMELKYQSLVEELAPKTTPCLPGRVIRFFGHVLKTQPFIDPKTQTTRYDQKILLMRFFALYKRIAQRLGLQRVYDQIVLELNDPDMQTREFEKIIDNMMISGEAAHKSLDMLLDLQVVGNRACEDMVLFPHSDEQGFHIDIYNDIGTTTLFDEMFQQYNALVKKNKTWAQYNLFERARSALLACAFCNLIQQNVTNNMNATREQSLNILMNLPSCDEQSMLPSLQHNFFDAVKASFLMKNNSINSVLDTCSRDFFKFIQEIPFVCEIFYQTRQKLFESLYIPSRTLQSIVLDKSDMLFNLEYLNLMRREHHFAFNALMDKCVHALDEDQFNLMKTFFDINETYGLKYVQALRPVNYDLFFPEPQNVSAQELELWHKSKSNLLHVLTSQNHRHFCESCESLVNVVLSEYHHRPHPLKNQLRFFFDDYETLFADDTSGWSSASCMIFLHTIIYFRDLLDAINRCNDGNPENQRKFQRLCAKFLDGNNLRTTLLVLCALTLKYYEDGNYKLSFFEPQIIDVDPIDFAQHERDVHGFLVQHSEMKFEIDPKSWIWLGDQFAKINSSEFCLK